MGAALAAKMVTAMAAIDAVTKRGKNEKQGYPYVKAADVANEVRSVLAANGIAFSYSVLGSEHWEKPTQSGGLLTFVQLMVEVKFTDKDSGESETMQTIGWGMDSGDKAPYKAMTGALKYSLRMAFLIPDESDAENDSGEDPRKPRQIAAEEKWNKLDPPTPENTKHTQLPPKRESPQTEDAGVFEAVGDRLTCIIKGVTEKQTKPNANGQTRPFLSVVWNGRYEGFNGALCFHASLFAALKGAVGKETQLVLKQDGKFLNVEDVLTVDGVPVITDQPF